jgi:hypothetical protein
MTLRSALFACLTLTVPAACAGVPPQPAQYAGETVTVTCRDMLVAGSNQIQQICLTPEGWEILERRLSEASAIQLRRLQGSAF